MVSILKRYNAAPTHTTLTFKRALNMFRLSFSFVKLTCAIFE